MPRRASGRGLGRDRRLVVRSAAARELTEAHDWYEDQGPGLGPAFLRAAEAVFAAVRRTPALYPVVRGRTRRALLRRFPYGVFFCEEEGEVVVLAVVHSSRDPQHWQSRAE
ncbi:MAG: type II toxin-antitoxin system RelE/ParE family toxin [Gemmatimonadaceae bacterium]